MRWADLNIELRKLIQRFPLPDVLIIHLGGNAIGKQKTLDIIYRIRDDLIRIQSSFPHSVIVFSEVVQRFCWLYPPALRPLEKN